MSMEQEMKDLISKVNWNEENEKKMKEFEKCTDEQLLELFNSYTKEIEDFNLNEEKYKDDNKKTISFFKALTYMALVRLQLEERGFDVSDTYFRLG